MNIYPHFIFLVISLSCPLLDSQVKIAKGGLISPVVCNGRATTISICAMFRKTSRTHIEAEVAVQMVIYSFCFSRDQSLLLHFQNSQGRPRPAALEAKYLASTYLEAPAIVKAASKEAHDHVPVFQSYADSIPTTPTFPRALQANQFNRQKHKVFVIPATLGSRYQLHQLAKKLNMTEVGYAWNIHPDQEEHDEPGIFASQAHDPVRALFCKPDTTNLFQRNSAAEPGVKLQFINWKKSSGKVVEYVNVIGKTHQSRYGMKGFGFPETINVEALYLNSTKILKDALFLASFVKEETDPKTNVTSFDGYSLGVSEEAKGIADVNNDLTYNFSFFARESDVLVTQITLGMFDAVVGDVAILKERRKYTDSSEKERRKYTDSGLVFKVPMPSRLPNHMQQTKRRRRILTSRSEPIRVGVPARSMFQQLVKVETDTKTNLTSYDGFSIKVFEEAMNIADVNNDLTYNYYSFDGEYDDLVKQIALGKFDVVAGDVTILEERHKYADFSQAYTESGMVLVVPIRSRLPTQMWLFMNPFTTELWGLILAITIYNGFTVWLIERNHNPEFRSGTLWNQFGTLFWPASTTLFSLSADKLQSNLSRMVMVVWLFVALILTQSYTSILSDMLTAQRLAPATKDVETLKKMNATVGYCRGSFLKSYMINALGFRPAQVKKYSSTSAYAKALKAGEIAGIFLEVPSAKLFLDQYCKSFMRTEKIFKVGGYGFAFKKNFPLLPAINKAILKISENGKLLELEQRYINSKECTEPVLFSDENASIGLDSFAILFVLTGCTSTFALAIYAIRHIICFLYSTSECINLFKMVSALTKRWIKHTRPSPATVISLENPGNPPDALCPEARQSVSTTIGPESLRDDPQAPGPDNKV